MLSVFPELFNYSQFGPFFLRLALAIVLIKIGYLAIFKPLKKYERAIGIAQWISALFLLLGFLTQIGALIALITSFKAEQKIMKPMIVAVALSLLFLGPGLLSFDLPL
jgi:hypothetical protein